MQTKLHRWAVRDPDRRFEDLYNLVCDPAFLVVAWTRVRGNRGARTAGVDGSHHDLSMMWWGCSTTDLPVRLWDLDLPHPIRPEPAGLQITPEAAPGSRLALIGSCKPC
jgi:hypothetical protein